MQTSEDKKELETLLNIVINQIPSYSNMVNSANWDVDIHDCIFGMVYHSFVAKSTDYMNNKLTDNNLPRNAESTFEMMNLISEVFNERLADIRQAIVSASNL
ncbi:MAG: hypothetical protein K5790_02645 [Nitrosopumilus sp.]|uniref:hypothetical protein n=1 Tax=Nitrosopumilus sp. TaxID=2024843 RepID=UPI00247C7E68|nr:hypothetical protein [Nitrosopumilus sp.]MCV0392175.1 hypothetical protein [Nitrosopumilus sp.]